MENEVLGHDKIIEELNEVLQIDIDAVGAYQEAIDSISEMEIKRQLVEFQGDHQRHVADLGAIIQRLGGKAEKSIDVKGALRKTMTKVAGLVGTETVLRAMLSNEKATNDVYAKHVEKPFPDDILVVLRRNFGDEQRHYAWIDMALRQRLWEATGPTATP
jgi:uncharacterized protein (TIGR02284 family)